MITIILIIVAVIIIGVITYGFINAWIHERRSTRYRFKINNPPAGTAVDDLTSGDLAGIGVFYVQDNTSNIIVISENATIEEVLQILNDVHHLGAELMD